MLLEVKWEFRNLFLFDRVILSSLTILKNCHASSTFVAVNSTWLSICESDVRPPIEMRWRPRAFCRVTTGDSDILSFVILTMSMHEASAGKFGLLSNQGISGSISLEA